MKYGTKEIMTINIILNMLLYDIIHIISNNIMIIVFNINYKYKYIYIYIYI